MANNIEPNSKWQRILFVEDEKTYYEILSERLTNDGYKVEVATDGQSAVDMFDEDKYDLVVLDLMLPKIGGEEVLRQIRKVSDIPVIVVSAKPMKSMS